MLKPPKNINKELNTKANTSLTFSVKRYKKYTLLYNTPIMLTIAGGHTRVSSLHNNHNHARKVSKNSYVILDDYTDTKNINGKTVYFNSQTGELLKTHHFKTKSKATTRSKVNKSSITRTDNKITDLIHANFNGAFNELMLTVTYVCTNTNKQVKKQVSNLILKIKRNLNLKTQNLLYLKIYELQGNGNWHCHILFKFLNADKEKMKNIKSFLNDKKTWKHGFNNLKYINRPDYLAKNYFHYDSIKKSNNNLDQQQINRKHKQEQKHLSLNNIPIKTRLFSYSQNCEKPKKIKTMYTPEVRKFLGTPLFTKAYRVSINNGLIDYGYNCFYGYYFNSSRANINAKELMKWEQMAIGNTNNRMIKYNKMTRSNLDPTTKKMIMDKKIRNKWYKVAKNNK